MATAAPEEEVVAEEPKKKKPIVLIIGGVVGLIVLIVGIVLGTLFFTGYFNPKPVVDPEHAEADAHGAGGGHGDKKDDKKPGKKTKDSPELTRFEYTYLQIEREFLVNVSGSKKVMSVQIAIAAIDAGDQLSAVSLYLEEWPDGPEGYESGVERVMLPPWMLG